MNGIVVTDSSYVSLINNRIDTYDDIVLHNACNTQIEGNTLGGGQGIYGYGTNNTITSNYIGSENPAGQQDGIYLSANYTTISKNLFKGQVGTSIVTGGLGFFYNTISDNTIISARLIIDGNTAFNKVFHNNIQATKGFILRSNAHNNTFYENTFDCEIYLPNTKSESPGFNNTFYDNNFVYAQPVRMDIAVANFWDNGSIGNYWSDYSIKYPDAKEINGTGIANTPYVINERNTDNYPLINQVNIEFLSPLPTPISPPANLRSTTQTASPTATPAPSSTNPTNSPKPSPIDPSPTLPLQH